MKSAIEPDLAKTDRPLEEIASSAAKLQADWAALSMLLAKELASRLPHDFQGLSDYAVSREGIYADHP